MLRLTVHLSRLKYSKHLLNYNSLITRQCCFFFLQLLKSIMSGLDFVYNLRFLKPNCKESTERMLYFYYYLFVVLARMHVFQPVIILK